MGMLFVLIFWAIVFVVLSLILGLITLPFSYFLCKKQRKRKMVLSFLTPGIFIGIYTASSLVCMIIIAIILGSDIGIGDGWAMPLKNGYELTSVDTPDMLTSIAETIRNALLMGLHIYKWLETLS